VKKLLIPLTLLLVCAFIITGCSGSTPPATTPATSSAQSKPAATTSASSAATDQPTAASPSSQPQSGGTLRVILGYGFGTNLGNPVVAGMNSYSSFYLPCCAEALTEFDSKGNMKPLLAESWDLDPNARTMVFHLRKGVKFHDGTDFNAAAVKWNWDVRIARGAIAGSDLVQSTDVIDDYTVKITFKSFSALNVYAFTIVQFMFSPTAVKTNGDEWAKLHPIGTGPFKVVDAKIDAYAKFERNDNYWGGKPYLDGIQFTVIPDSMVAQASMLAKQADMWAESVSPKDAQNAKDKGLSVFTRSSLVSFMCPDSTNTNSPMANQKVREAVEYAINKEALNKTFTLGFGESLYQAANAGSVANNPDYKGRKYDPAKAKQLLAEAGFPKGFKTKMMTSTDQNSRDIGTAIQGFLGEVGIDLTLDPADSARYFDAQNNGWKEGYWYGAMGINPGLSYVQFICSNFRPNQKPTITRSKEFTDLYNKLMAVPDLTTADTLGKQIILQMANEAMIVPTIATINARVTQSYVHTNYLNIHHRVWDVNLDWMDKH
jgi:peptide/nickel transport system substrate-binding protein